MSTAQKDWISRWLPLLVAIAANIITIAYSYGKLEQRLTPIEEYTRVYTYERAAANFVTRVEFVAAAAHNDKETDELKQALREINQKLDRLVERSSR